MKNLSITLLATLLCATMATTASAKNKTADSEDFLDFLSELDADLDKKPAPVPEAIAKVQSKKKARSARVVRKSVKATKQPVPWMMRQLAETTSSVSKGVSTRRSKRTGHLDVDDGSSNDYLQQHLVGNRRARSSVSLYDSVGSVGGLAR